jgi:single-strand DNA-binding protein
MSSGMNRVTLFGNLGQDPELRTTKDNVAILRMRIATTESWFDKETKQAQERTEWHDVVIFGARAEGLSRILKKGDSLLIDGTLRTASVEKDGVKKWYTDVIAREVLFPSRPRRPNDDVAARQPEPRRPLGSPGVVEADLPF